MIERNIVKPRGNRAKTQSVIHMNDMKKIDEIIVQQYCIRRLRLESPTEFTELMSFRKELDDILKDAGFTIPTKPIKASRVSALMGCLRFVELKKNRKLLCQGEREIKSQALLDELVDNSSIDVAKHLLSGEVVDRLLSALLKWEPFVTEFENKYNYLKYYSLFGVTNYAPGDVIFKRFFEAYHGLDDVYFDAQMFRKEALWLHSKKSYCDEHLAPLVSTGANEVIHFSSNIQILGGGQHKIVVEGSELKNHLVLAIPTNQTPDNIDESLRKLRIALMNEFVEQGGYYRFSSQAFTGSRFMSDFAYKPCVVGQWNRVKNKIVGLWAWDLSRDNTVTDTVRIVRERMGEVAKDAGMKATGYSEKSIQAYYESAVGQIGTGRRMGDNFVKIRDIDRQVTKSEIVLGLVERQIPS